MKSLTPIELKKILTDEPDSIELIDVREGEEHDSFNIGGNLISFMEILDNRDLIRRDKPVVMYCSKGIRSFLAIQRLEEKYQYDNLYNLSGGIDAWKKQIG